MTDLAHENAHLLLGELSAIDGKLTGIEEILRDATGPARRWRRLTWQAAAFDKYDDGRAANGYLIWNDGASDAYIAQSSADLNASRAIVTIPAGTYAVLPLESSRLFAGGAAAGTVQVVSLDYVPTIAAGSIRGATVDAVVQVGAVSAAYTQGQRVDLQAAPNGGLVVAVGQQNYADSGNATAHASLSTLDAIGRPLQVLSYLFNGTDTERPRTPKVFKVVNGVAAGAGVDVTVWTPSAGKKFRLMGFQLFGSANTNVLFKDNTAGSVIFIGYAATVGNAPAIPPNLGNGILSAAANNVLAINCAGASTINGVVWGTEE